MLRKHRKAILFNYAGTGEHRREKKNWLRVRELGIDGMLTDYALECAKLWQANPLEKKLKKSTRFCFLLYLLGQLYFSLNNQTVCIVHNKFDLLV